MRFSRYVLHRVPVYHQKNEILRMHTVYASGDRETRTPDPLPIWQMLIQLSCIRKNADPSSCPEAISIKLCYVSNNMKFQTSGLKWTRTTDLTLIRRAL